MVYDIHLYILIVIDFDYLFYNIFNVHLHISLDWTDVAATINLIVAVKQCPSICIPYCPHARAS